MMDKHTETSPRLFSLGTGGLPTILLVNYAYVVLLQTAIALVIEFILIPSPPYDFMPHPSCPDTPECEAAWATGAFGLRLYGYVPAIVASLLAVLGWKVRAKSGWLQMIPLGLLNFTFCAHWLRLEIRSPSPGPHLAGFIFLSPIVALTVAYLFRWVSQRLGDDRQE